ncbi:PEGA domain-containing protein [Deinococcus knuensis]|uniref:PEGA domain-containing protein n=1 Tax=Deinococcus knuensis TaxID=1837380 RepID=A0ABQ2SED2_9DEIO|nr:PEGA domain-containing protein [Deinococcus knuensis]GGS16105.1 hypothetical protein GCM10008961_04530 [Deinococcus knuensis]
MKPIGPYVAARELPGRTGSPVRTLRATDRLTGMPVLLHVLPYPLTLPELPDHPGLLPVVDSGVDGEQAYVVTELPLQARPADDALLTARGALAALGALHERGLTHGGLNAAQLWSVDGRVLLAGAGLPWGGEPLPSDDLYALGVILAEMGHLPDALRPLTEQPGHLSAVAALARLNSEQAARPVPQTRAAHGPDVPEQIAPAQITPAQEASGAGATVPEASGQESPAGAVSAGPQDSPAPPAVQTPPTRTPLLRGRGGSKRGRQGRRDANASALPAPTQPAPSDSTPSDSLAGSVPVEPAPPAPLPVMDWSAGPVSAPHDGSPIVLGPVGPETTELEPTGPDPAELDPAGPESSGPGDSDREASADAPPAGLPEPERPGTERPESGVMPSASVPSASVPSASVPSASVPGAPAPAAGGPETPQERRRRQNEERRAQAMLDAQAAAARKARRLREERAQRLAEGGGDAPIQIGGGPVVGGTAVGGVVGTAPGAVLGTVLGDDDLPAWDGPPVDGEAAPRPQLRMRDVDRLPPGLRREPLPEPEPEPAPRLPARRAPGDPIRIGWDEDDSWRVVREVPVPPERPRRRLPRWTLLVVAAALLLGGAWWALGALPGRTPARQVTPQNDARQPESRQPEPRQPGGESATSAPATATDGASAGGAIAQAGSQADPACCEVEFRLLGAQGRTVALTVEAAPPGADLTPGESLGRAPGTVRFPLPGTYRLRTSISGYAPASLSVTVPTTKPKIIDLGN